MPLRNARKGGQLKPAWGLQDIRELIDVLVEREITEFEMEKDGFRIRIKRGVAHETTAVAIAPTPLSPELSPSLPPSPLPSPVPVESSSESTEGLHIIKSPIVGTFYSAPTPDAPAFVKLGDGVQVGQVLCILEAMKLMNEIESEVAGEIVRIYVENGQPVEYGQSLFAIKPSHKR